MKFVALVIENGAPVMAIEPVSDSPPLFVIEKVALTNEPVPMEPKLCVAGETPNVAGRTAIPTRTFVLVPALLAKTTLPVNPPVFVGLNPIDRLLLPPLGSK